MMAVWLLLLFQGLMLFFVGSESRVQIFTQKVEEQGRTVEEVKQFIKVPAVEEAFGTLVLWVVILAAAAFLLMYILQWADMPTASVVVPLFALLTVSTVFQWCRSSKMGFFSHMQFIMLGMVVMVLSACVTRVCCEREMPLVQLVLLGMLLIVGVILFGHTAMCYFRIYVLHQAQADVLTNGSAAFVRLFGIDFMPCELMKLLTVIFAGLGSVQLRNNGSIKKWFSIIALFCVAAVFLSNDLGNLLILMAMIVLIIWMTYGIKIAARWMMLGGVLCVLGYGALRLFRPNGAQLRRITSAGTILADPTANANQRRALLAAIRSGWMGSGLKERFFAVANTAAETDYCYSELLSIFGVGMAVLVVVCLCALAHCGMKREECGGNSALYMLSNGMMMILLLQALIHVGGNLDVFPFTGVTLPFISKGGTSMLCNFCCLGIAVGGKINSQKLMKIRRFRRRKEKAADVF